MLVAQLGHTNAPAWAPILNFSVLAIVSQGSLCEYEHISSFLTSIHASVREWYRVLMISPVVKSSHVGPQVPSENIVRLITARGSRPPLTLVGSDYSRACRDRTFISVNAHHLAQRLVFTLEVPA